MPVHSVEGKSNEVIVRIFAHPGESGSTGLVYRGPRRVAEIDVTKKLPIESFPTHLKRVWRQGIFVL